MFYKLFKLLKTSTDFRTLKRDTSALLFLFKKNKTHPQPEDSSAHEPRISLQEASTGQVQLPELLEQFRLMALLCKFFDGFAGVFDGFALEVLVFFCFVFGVFFVQLCIIV